MSPIKEVIINKNTNINPIWIMRQAGRYLPEFREIRKINTNFIDLCLNEKLSSEITIQPLKRFDLDAAIIFSDILILPHGLGQKVEFKKDFGPKLDQLNLEEITKLSEEDFVKKIKNVYKAINLVNNHDLLKNKSTIGFIGAPWTLLVYMLNRQSPKRELKKNFFDDKSLIDSLLIIIEKFLKIHIKNQIDNGAEIIQIFDSWAGLIDDNNLSKFIYHPTLNLVKYTKSLNTPVICFPRGIKDYKKYCDFINPDVVCIDYEVDPLKIIKDIKIPVQGGLNPKALLSDRETLKKETLNYLNIFKDHPYIFNLGHGIQPETKIEMVDELVKIVKDFK